MTPLPSSRAARLEYLLAVVAVAVCTTVDWVVADRFDLASLVMVYLAGVLVVAYRSGRGPSVAAAIGSVAAFDWFFLPPRFTFAVANAQHLVTFGVMLAVALIIGDLTARVKREAERTVRLGEETRRAES